MTFQPNLAPGQRISNQDLCDLFLCGPQGGMRKSNRRNCLVLFTDHAKSLYDDRWDENGILHYTGMGLIGDQTLSRSNKTLAESPMTGIQVFYFERFTGKSTDYIFVGEVELADSPYKEVQPDTEGNYRSVWVFPLKLITGAPAPEIQVDELSVTLIARQKAAKALSDQDLTRRLRNRPKSSARTDRSVCSVQHPRDPLVVEFALRRAQGCCELCEQPAPFLKPGGEPYLEVHHIEWLSEGGRDTTDNVAALCPNCHRQMHSLNKAGDRKKLQRSASQKSL
ncbi:HNH endonuclease [Pontibacterium sp. N1Y112]|uniref:HNH endonuclease n=1 Tax=Pontibacterium sinense TaxID=2781979 RepID=A0A8J7FA60_9GAMM|nr:HNH endonuclease [Pontibacterium sinense]MBE9395739.1 HNH endonuclease [Pontibacterium sinense]